MANGTDTPLSSLLGSLQDAGFFDCYECAADHAPHTNADGQAVCDDCFNSYARCTLCDDWSSTSDDLCTYHADEAEKLREQTTNTNRGGPHGS